MNCVLGPYQINFSFDYIVCWGAFLCHNSYDQNLGFQLSVKLYIDQQEQLFTVKYILAP